jgi:hypothetical protein
MAAILPVLARPREREPSKEMRMRIRPLLVVAVIAALPIIPLAGHASDDQAKDDKKHDDNPPAPAEAAVNFGVLPFPATTPLGPPPCLQTGAIGGPADPCAYKLHHLDPEEVSIAKGGEVTFQIHGGGHAMAIYRVSKNTTRDDLGQFLCAGNDPEHIADPTMHVCNLSTTNANAPHNIADGKGDVVIVASANVTNAHPDNRVWYVPGRRMSAGGRQFLNGGTIPAGATSDGQLITYQFLKTGRYLVHCMNRTHFLNDWMFGFVNVGK